MFPQVLGGGSAARFWGILLSGLLMWMEAAPLRAAQEPAAKLNIVVMEGEGAINNIKQRTTREVVVEVQDENHKPVAGAAVSFLLPQNGAGGTFTNGGRLLTATTDQNGRATASLRPNGSAGEFRINVTASSLGQNASAVIVQTNALGVAAGAAAGAGAGAGSGIGVAAIVGIVAAAAAVGAVTAWKVTQDNTKRARVSVGQPSLP